MASGTGSGEDFEMLYPEVFAEIFITQCKLQMMQLVQQSQNWRIGSSWLGIYLKITNEAIDFVRLLDDQVAIVNGGGGAGMILSFGLGEEVVDGLKL